MKTIQLLFLCTLGISSGTKAQTIWGAGSGNATTEAIGEFANAFGTTNAWTAVDITPNAFWVRTLSGVSQGAYATGSTPINSPSMANGVALFDSDFMDNGGTQGAFGTGTCPSPHRGELHSPAIDLTGYTDISLNAKLYLNYRNFAITEISIGFSSDGGVTWNDFSIDQGVAVNAAFAPAFITVPLTDVTAGIANLGNCKLRLTFDGDYYYLMIDDLSLEVSCVPPTAPANTTLSSDICSGNSATLSATGSGTLGWYEDASGTVYLSGGNSFTTGALTSDTTFYVQDSTCSAGPLTAISIHINQPASYSQNITLCPNETLTVGNSVYNSAGTYTDVLSTISGCDSTVTSTISISSVDVSVAANGMTLTANANGATYQWIDCDNGSSSINGATNQSFTANVDGSYAVIVTMNNCSDTSTCVTVSDLGVDDNNVFQWVVSPNPTNNFITVEASEEIILIELLSVEGMLLKVADSSTISVTDYPSGIYLLRILTNKGVAIARFIKE